MPFSSNPLKKIALVLLVSCSIAAAFVLPAKAQVAAGAGAEGLLAQIAENTKGILEKVDTLPDRLKKLVDLSLKWILVDTSMTTANLQKSFTELANENSSISERQKDFSLQRQLLAEYLGDTVTPKNFPGVNDISFSTLNNQLFFNPDPRKKENPSLDPAYNYIKTASGLLINHTSPTSGLSWVNKDNAFLNYVKYYNTISAVQTYNAYIMSKLYIDAKNNHKLSDAQQALIKQASSSDWFIQVASERIGIVLRQILMYISQSYVLQIRTLDTQKDMLTAQAMTNTLLVLLNLQNEDILVKKATGQMAT